MTKSTVDTKRAEAVAMVDRDARVETVMHWPAVSIEADCSAAVALRELLACGIRHLVVVDSKGRGVGVLADRILAACWAEHPDALERTRVDGLLGERWPFVGAEATIAEAATVMRYCGLDAVAVLDRDGRPAGVLTTTDLINIIAGGAPTRPVE